MAVYSTGQDIVNGVLRRVGESTSFTNDNTAILNFINKIRKRLYRGQSVLDVNTRHDWLFLRSQYPGALILDIAYETGTIEVTNGSDTATFSSSPAASQANKWLKIDERPELYRISAHTGGTDSATLDSNYADESGSGLGYKALQFDYTLAATIARILGPIQSARANSFGNTINYVDPDRFAIDYPIHKANQGVPTMFTETYEAGGQVSLRFNKYPDQQTRIQFDYATVPTDYAVGTSVVEPEVFLEAIEAAAAYYYAVDRRDARAAALRREAQTLWSDLVSSKQSKDDKKSELYGYMAARPVGQKVVQTEQGIILR